MNLEKLLHDARLLSARLKESETVADNLINQSTNVRDRFEAMKQYEEDLNKLNEIPKRKPRQKLIMEIAHESRQIKDLKNENLELKACLDEHQNAMELIMNKYREQMRQFMMTQKLEENILSVLKSSNISEAVMKEKIMEMVEVMKTASTLDDQSADTEQEKIAELLIENRGLKELLKINQRLGVPNIGVIEAAVQVDIRDADLSRLSVGEADSTVNSVTSAVETR